MAMDLMQQTNGQDSNESRDTLFLLSGVAMVVFGAGLILSTPVISRALGGVGVGNLVTAALPDFQRYLKLRGM
jgi:hypothetical protein